MQRLELRDTMNVECYMSLAYGLLHYEAIEAGYLCDSHRQLQGTELDV